MSDCILQIFKESPGVRAVHLCMMKLERNGHVIPEQLPSVSAPDHKRVVENAGVHAHRAVKFRVNDR